MARQALLSPRRIARSRSIASAASACNVQSRSTARCLSRRMVSGSAAPADLAGRGRARPTACSFQRADSEHRGQGAVRRLAGRREPGPSARRERADVRDTLAHRRHLGALVGQRRAGLIHKRPCGGAALTTTAARVPASRQTPRLPMIACRSASAGRQGITTKSATRAAASAASTSAGGVSITTRSAPPSRAASSTGCSRRA